MEIKDISRNYAHKICTMYYIYICIYILYIIYIYARVYDFHKLCENLFWIFFTFAYNILWFVMSL